MFDVCIVHSVLLEVVQFIKLSLYKICYCSNLFCIMQASTYETINFGDLLAVKLLIFTIKEQTPYWLGKCTTPGFLELLELFLSTLGFLDLDNVESDCLTQRTTLTHYHKIT